MDYRKIEKIIYSNNVWNGSIKEYRSYGPEFITWLSNQTSLPTWMILSLIIILLIFLSVKLTEKFFTKSKCTGKRHFWVSFSVLTISAIGLFAPNIANTLGPLTSNISNDWFITMLPEQLVNFFKQGRNTANLFFDNTLDYCAYYCTTTIAFISIAILVLNRKNNKLDFFTSLGNWLFITSGLIIVIFCILFIVVPMAWIFICGVITIFIKSHGLYYPIAYFLVWLTFIVSQIAIKLEFIIKLLILSIFISLCIKSMMKINE